ncbi:MAG: MFS transporter [Spirochaetota bacterium]
MKQNIKKNIIVIIIDAIGWHLGMSFLSPQTLLPLFVARLSGSNFLIGLLVGIQSFGQLVPQLFAVNRIERLKVKKNYVVLVGIFVERLPYLVLTIIIFLNPVSVVILVTFYVCWVIVNSGAGINVPAYLELFAKTVPENRRGKSIGAGNFVGLFLAVAGAYAARFILENARGLSGYGWCFLIGFFILFVSILPLKISDEPPAAESTERRRIREFFSEIIASLKTDVDFKRYLKLQIFLQAGYTGVAFITGYTVLSLGVSDGTVAVCTAILMASSALGSLLFGLLGDAKGYKLVFILGGVSAVLLYAIMVFSPGITVMYFIYILSGLFSGSITIGINMTLEYCKMTHASRYSAIVFTATAPFRTAMPLFAGFIADIMGNIWVFVILGVICAVGLFFSIFEVKDPRFIRTRTG